MTREFLEGLGLEKDVVEAVMKEHGKTMQLTKSSLEEAVAKSDALQEQLNQRDEDLTEFQRLAADHETLKSQLQENTGRYEKEKHELAERLEALRKSSAVELSLTQSGARNVKAVAALLDLGAVTVKDDKIDGLKEQIEKLQEVEPYLFEAAKDPSGQAVVTGNPRQGKNSTPNPFKEAVDKMTKR